MTKSSLQSPHDMIVTHHKVALAIYTNGYRTKTLQLPNEPWLLRKFCSWSSVHAKRSIQRGSYEGFGMRNNVKRLKVDCHQQSCLPQVVNLKHGNERRGFAPSNSFCLSAPTHAKGRPTGQFVPHGKKVVDPTKMGIRRKLEMQPPKAITKAILVRMGPNGLSQTVHFNSHNRQDYSSFEPHGDSRLPDIKEMPPARLNPVSSSRGKVLPNGMYDVGRRPLEEEIIRADNDGMEVEFQYDEDARELAENDLKDTAAFDDAGSTDLKVTRLDKFRPVIPSASKRKLEDRKKSGIACSSQSNKVKSNLRCHLVSGNNRNVARSRDKETQYDFERPNLTESDSCLITDRPKTECTDLAPSFGVGVTAKHQAKATLSRTTYNLVGLKNEITSSNESNYLEFKVDKAKDSELSFAKVKSGGAGTVGVCTNSGVCNFSLASKNTNDLGSIPYGYQEPLCRDKVRKAVDLYKETLEKFKQEDKLKPKGQGKVGMQIYVAAAMQLKEQHEWINVNKPVGAVPGVEIGDHFLFRAELVIVGLHRKFFAGIDYKKIDGETCATSIISSDLYGDKNESPDILTYMGEGNSKKPEDQKLMRGNLALKNSLNKVPVRVIRSCQSMKASKMMDTNIMKKSTYIYDGLYFVTDYRQEVAPSGRLVYKFQLKRIEGQHKLTGWRTLNGPRKFKKSSYGPVVVDDISQGEEKMPIRVINAIDCEKPPPFKYITKMMYVEQCILSTPSGCDCINGCSSEDIPCSCVIKNNCSVPSSDIVSISEKNPPIVYECGPSCKCSPDCKNRVSQKGMRLQLEIFKTKSMRWGVRSRNFITAGRFVCEYVGELLQYNQNEERINFDESVYDTGNCYGNQVSQWYPNMPSSWKEDDNYAKNAKFGNVGRFIKHSCSPNLYAKCVLFDHGDKSRPHVMLFTAKNIAPLVELTFDYKLW